MNKNSEYINRYADALDEMSKKIKESQEYLRNFPITEFFQLEINESLFITWTVSLKKIEITYLNASGFRECRFFLECPLKIRLQIYPFLPRFIDQIVDEEKNRTDTNLIKKISEQINILIK